MARAGRFYVVTPGRPGQEQHFPYTEKGMCEAMAEAVLASKFTEAAQVVTAVHDGTEKAFYECRDGKVTFRACQGLILAGEPVPDAPAGMDVTSLDARRTKVRGAGRGTARKTRTPPAQWPGIDIGPQRKTRTRRS